MTAVDVTAALRPLLPNNGKKYEVYLQKLETGDELDGAELMESISEGCLDEMLEEELGVTKKRHCRRLREAIITLAKNDVSYKAIVDFLAEYNIDKFFNRFIRAGVTTPDDLITLYRKGDVQSFLENPPMHLKDCLLYTSPSPRDKRQSRMPSSA